MTIAASLPGPTLYAKVRWSWPKTRTGLLITTMTNSQTASIKYDVRLEPQIGGG